jgi:phage gp46-like protein
MTSRFSGDPAIKITPDGARMKFRGGQCEMDAGISNYVQISLFTRKNKNGWWGNTLLTDPNQKIGSDFAKPEPVIDVQTINTKRDNARTALKAMTDSKLASKIDITVTNPRLDYIKTDIKIYPPGQDIQELLFLKNGINWIMQAQNPSYKRMEDIE